MADKDEDKDQFDEYQFADLDGMGSEPIDENQGLGETPPESGDVEKKPAAPTNIRRNALIVIGIVIVAMILYKFLGSYLSERKLEKKTAVAVVNPTPTPAPVQQPVVPAAQQEPPVVTTSESPSPRIDQKLSTLEVSQQSMRSEVASVNNQLGGLSNSVNALSTQIAQLNQIITALSTKVDEQSHELEQLTIRTRRKVTRSTTVKVSHGAHKYYIQAVIPGRAWLITPNGATLTVREGTVIPGYGMVKLIDPIQGRITMSSGQIIRFSQEDS